LLPNITSTDLITLQIQSGHGAKPDACFSKIVSLNLRIRELEQQIREEQNIPNDLEVLLLCQGKRLNEHDTIFDHREMLRNNALINCIFKGGYRKNWEEEEQYQDDKAEPVLECEFKSRPFGFAVWANHKGENGIVTKVCGSEALDLGIQIGYCVYKVNDICMFNKPYKEVMRCLKKSSCPLRITFLDLGQEYTIAFKTKPLGFTVNQDKEDNNARVSKINMRAAALGGVKIGSYITAVNNQLVFGMKHRDILTIISKSLFPINIRFRRPPKLRKKDRGSRKKK